MADTGRRLTDASPLSVAEPPDCSCPCHALTPEALIEGAGFEAGAFSPMERLLLACLLPVGSITTHAELLRAGWQIPDGQGEFHDAQMLRMNVSRMRPKLRRLGHGVRPEGVGAYRLVEGDDTEALARFWRRGNVSLCLPADVVARVARLGERGMSYAEVQAETGVSPETQRRIRRGLHPTQQAAARPRMEEARHVV